MKPLFSKVLRETVYNRVTIRLVRSLTGWHVCVIDNERRLAPWGYRYSKTAAIKKYNALVAKYKDLADTIAERLVMAGGAR